MSNTIYHGRHFTLAAGFEPDYRQAQSTPAAQLLKYSTLDFNRNPQRQEDETIDPQALANKRDEGDETPEGTLNAIMCLNDFGFWAKMMWGQPVTTGSAGAYTHVFSLGLNDRPSALFELAGVRSGGSRFHRFLGGMLRTLSWDVLAAQQSIETSLLFSNEVRPQPTTAYMTTPAAKRVKARAEPSRAAIYDVQGSSTLGRVGGCTVSFDNDLDPQAIGDALPGYGVVLLGQPKLSGTLKVFFEDGTVVDHARANLSRRLVCSASSRNGAETLVLNIPDVQFDEPPTAIPAGRGLTADIQWSAHYAAGSAAPTLTLTNAIPTY